MGSSLFNDLYPCALTEPMHNLYSINNSSPLYSLQSWLPFDVITKAGGFWHTRNLAPTCHDADRRGLGVASVYDFQGNYRKCEGYRRHRRKEITAENFGGTFAEWGKVDCKSEKWSKSNIWLGGDKASEARERRRVVKSD